MCAVHRAWLAPPAGVAPGHQRPDDSNDSERSTEVAAPRERLGAERLAAVLLSARRTSARRRYVRYVALLTSCHRHGRVLRYLAHLQLLKPRRQCIRPPLAARTDRGQIRACPGAWSR